MNQNTVTRAECFEWTQFTNGPLLSREDAKRLAYAHLELLLEVEEIRRKLADAEANKAILG